MKRSAAHKVGLEYGVFTANPRFPGVTKSGPLISSRAAWNDPFAIADRPTFDPLSAGGMLLGVLVACVGIGTLVGWAAGAPAIGLMIGSVVGIPAAIVAVYRAYGGAL